MCSISVGLVDARRKDLSRQTGDDVNLAFAFWLAAGANIVFFITAILIFLSIFIREPFPEDATPILPPDTDADNRNNASTRSTYAPNELPQRYFDNRTSVISESPTDFSSSSFGSTSVLPSIADGIETNSTRISYSLQGAMGLSVSDSDIFYHRSSTAAINLAADFSDDSLDEAFTENNGDIELHSVENSDGEVLSSYKPRISDASSHHQIGKSEHSSRLKECRTDSDQEPHSTSVVSLHMQSTDDTLDDCIADGAIGGQARTFNMRPLALSQHEFDC